MFCQVNEYLRRGWRCQRLPSGQKGRAHISIVLTALHPGHRLPIPPPERPRGCTPVQADCGRPRLNFLICQMGARVQARSISPKKKKILDFFFLSGIPEFQVGAEGLRPQCAIPKFTAPRRPSVCQRCGYKVRTVCAWWEYPEKTPAPRYPGRWPLHTPQPSSGL